MVTEHIDTRNKINAARVASSPIVQPSTVIAAAPAKERRHAEFFDVIGSSIAINTPEQFVAWAQGDLQNIFPHGMLICGIGQIDNQDAHIQQFLTSNFPLKYLKTLHETGGLNTSPVICQWIKTRCPVLFETAEHKCKSLWLDNVERHGLYNMAVHGQCDLNSRTTSYFSFSNIPGKLNARHTILLEMLVPHLHAALIRVFKGAKKETRKSRLLVLTERQHEILQWLCSGKTNWEIAQVLQISEHTVKNHVQVILNKLKVNTRAQAVAKLLIPS